MPNRFPFLEDDDLYRFTMDHSREMIFWVAPDASFYYVNQAVCDKLGYEFADFRSLKVFDINPEFSLANWPDHWRDLREQGGMSFETRLRRRNGKFMPVSISLNYLHFEGREYNCVFVRDISAERERQERLEELLAEVEGLRRRLEDEKNYLQEEISLEYNFKNILTANERYKHVLKQVEQVAATDATVLLLGETGTGKELLARALHHLSARRDRPLVKVNCAALPADLIESELFGHEKGAFTGAIQTKVGRFELAAQGTIFLDEIGELPLALQSKLLRVLQEGEFQRLGSPQTHRVDVRVIAATNRRLAERVRQGKFREDLFYRLNVFPIYSLPLRERPEDIPLLLRHFLQKYADKMGKQIDKVPKAAMERLMQYEFPGNVRELQNLIERAVILTTGPTLQLRKVLPDLKQAAAGKERSFRSFEQVQRDHILEALRRTHWRVSGKMGAARILGLNPKTLASKMRKLGIRREDHLDL